MRPAKLAAYLFGGSVALGAALYVVVYLYRWQWQRAILCGVMLLVVEVLLLGLAILDRVSRLEQRLAEHDRRDEERPPRAAEPAPAAARPRFAWLDQALERERHTFVFVPVLMAAGVALSGAAWVVERVARATVRPTATRRLATRLTPLATPPGTLHGGAPDLPERPALGPPDRRRTWGRAAGWALLAVACVGLVIGLARLTQTKPPEQGTADATTVLFTLDSNGLPEARATLAAQQQWERCRDATSLPLTQAGMTPLGDGLFAATVHPALSEHDTHRLRGCLEDATIDRIQLQVLSTGTTP